MIPEKLRRQIAADALQSCGSGIRWHSLLHQNKLKIGMIGGSVTQGYSAGGFSPAAYPTLFADGLRELGYDIEAFVCAEAGMGSMEGNLLADSQILQHQPDLVVLEFAINETTLRPSVIAFESLLRKLLCQPEPPVVCFLLIRSMDDYSCESFMLPLAEHYGLPCIRLRKGLNPVLERGELCWADYGDPESHPTDDGQRLLADCLLHLIKTAQSLPDESPEPIPEPWLDAPYQAMRYVLPNADCSAVQTAAPICPRQNHSFPTAFLLSPDTGGMRMQIECEALLIFYEAHHLPEYGACRIIIDGEPFNPPVLHSNSIYGWGNAKYVIAVPPGSRALHTVTLEPTEGNFYVLGFGIC